VCVCVCIVSERYFYTSKSTSSIVLYFPIRALVEEPVTDVSFGQTQISNETGKPRNADGPRKQLSYHADTTGTADHLICPMDPSFVLSANGFVTFYSDLHARRDG